MNDNMIGNKKVIEKIQNLLKQIAEKNNQKYGCILDATDCGPTIITLGWGKVEYDDNQVKMLKFDIINGTIIDCDGCAIGSIYAYYNYFRLSKSFEEDMNDLISKLQIEFNKVGIVEIETISRLQKIVGSSSTEMEEVVEE